VLVALLNLIWRVPFVAIVGIAIPDKILTIPILCRLRGWAVAHFFWLYGCGFVIPRGQMLGAVFARHGPAVDRRPRGRFGLIKDGLPFIRTAKGGSGRRSVDFPAFWEAVIGGLLVASAVFLACDQLGACSRDRPVLRWRSPFRTAPVPGLGRAGRAGRQPPQQLRVLARPRSTDLARTLTRRLGCNDDAGPDGRPVPADKHVEPAQ